MGAAEDGRDGGLTRFKKAFAQVNGPHLMGVAQLLHVGQDQSCLEFLSSSRLARGTLTLKLCKGALLIMAARYWPRSPKITLVLPRHSIRRVYSMLRSSRSSAWRSKSVVVLASMNE